MPCGGQPNFPKRMPHHVEPQRPHDCCIEPTLLGQPLKNSLRFAPHSKVLILTLIPLSRRLLCRNSVIGTGSISPEPLVGTHHSTSRPLGWPASLSSCLALVGLNSYGVIEVS